MRREQMSKVQSQKSKAEQSRLRLLSTFDFRLSTDQEVFA